MQYRCNLQSFALINWIQTLGTNIKRFFHFLVVFNCQAFLHLRKHFLNIVHQCSSAKTPTSRNLKFGLNLLVKQIIQHHSSSLDKVIGRFQSSWDTPPGYGMNTEKHHGYSKVCLLWATNKEQKGIQRCLSHHHHSFSVIQRGSHMNKTVDPFFFQLIQQPTCKNLLYKLIAKEELVQFILVTWERK